MLLLNAGALLVTVALTLALVPSMGARGAALATLGTESVLAVGVVAVLIRARPDLLGGLRGVVPVLALAGAAIAVGLLPDWPAIVALVVGNVVFAAGLVVLRRVPPELRQVLRRV
jgi:O-antigen/teichoic acid export membrane protein